MDETPDQILARLQRHAESIQRAPGGRERPLVPPRTANPPARPTTPSGLPPRSVLQGLKVPGREPGPTTEAATGPRVVVWGEDRAADLIPIDIGAVPRFGLLLRTIAGQAVAVISCLLALWASVALSSLVTLIIVGVAGAVGVVASVRRVPLAGWWTLGWLLGWVLGRFS